MLDLPVPIAEDLDGADLALTCQACRNSPATHLVVAYLHVRKLRQVQRLNCQRCADYALRHAQTGDHLYLFRLVPEEIRECRHCGRPIRRCTGPCATAPDPSPWKGWRHWAAGATGRRSGAPAFTTPGLSLTRCTSPRRSREALVPDDETFRALLGDAARFAAPRAAVTPALIQRHVRVGFATAYRLVLSLEDAGIIGPPEASGKRPVIAGPATLNEFIARHGPKAEDGNPVAGQREDRPHDR